MDEMFAGVRNRTEFANRVRHGLILSGLGAIETSGTITITREGDLFVVGHTMRAESSPYFVQMNESLEIDVTRKLLQLLEGFKRPQELELAVHRLGLARSEPDGVNKALDLGLALEIALMAGAQTERTEITNKLGIRAGWLVGNTPDERLAAYKLAGQLYEARSSAAHRGIFTKEVLKRYDFKQCNALVQRILVNLLHRGDFPKWTELSLGIPANADQNNEE